MTSKKQVENYLSNLLFGQSIDSWIENRIFDLINSSSQIAPPLQLNQNLLELRQITGIQINEQLTSSGHLIVNNNSFTIELPKESTNWFQRFIIAHEIAHTYLYVQKNSIFQLISGVNNGDLEVEWFCNYFARCLLAPNNWIKKIIESIGVVTNCEVYGQQLIFLSQKFRIPERIMAQRLVEDLSVWNQTIIGFSNIKINIDGSFSDEWRMIWSVKPQILKNTLFIPFGKVTNNKVIYPRVKGNLLQTLGNIYGALKVKRTINLQIPKLSLKSSTLGNFYSSKEKDKECNIVLVYDNNKDPKTGQLNEEFIYLLISN